MNHQDHEKEMEVYTETDMTDTEQPPIIVVHPWYRYFARGIDLVIASLPLSFLLIPVFITVGDKGAIVNFIIITLCTILFTSFLEAGLLSLFGTTPGKWIFGIKILTSDGNKLTYFQGFKRCFWVWVKGLGLNIPFVAFITQLAAYDHLKREGATSWDKQDGFIVHHKEIGTLRATLAIILYFAIRFYLEYINI